MSYALIRNVKPLPRPDGLGIKQIAAVSIASADGVSDGLLLLGFMGLYCPQVGAINLQGKYLIPHTSKMVCLRCLV